MNNKVVILIGPPGSGKGTLSEHIVEHEPLYVHLAPGDIFRNNIENKTELGLKIQKDINDGNLVNEEIVSQIMYNEIKKNCSKNIILDGYPRSDAQNSSFLKIIKRLNIVNYFVIYMKISRQDILKRIDSRLICPKCGAVYNSSTDRAPKVENMCDFCNNQKLEKRSDDNFEIISKRISVYNSETASILDYYKKEKLLYIVDGNLDSGEIYDIVKKYL